MNRGVPSYIALVRIAAVIGMGTALAFGIFVLLAGYWLGLAIMACALPFFALMWVFERVAAGHEARRAGD